METRLLNTERLDRMIDARDVSEAAKVLAECGYGELSEVTASAVEELLAGAQADLFQDLGGAVKDRRLLDVFRCKYDYHNAKVLVKAEALGTEEDRLMLGGGRYDRMIGKFCGQDVYACGFSIGFERIVTILKDHMQGESRIAGEAVAYLIGSRVPTERKAEVLARAAQERSGGATVTVLPMAKNIKHQCELLEAEGFTRFEKIYE